MIPLRRWTHVAYVLKGGAALSLYVNGIKECPMLGARNAGCPPAGATYSWDDGDVLHNQGPIYVGADPYSAGTPMYLDELKIYNHALAEKEVRVEASNALGAVPTDFLRLGCTRCEAAELSTYCAALDDYHPCMCEELMGGGLGAARNMCARPTRRTCVPLPVPFTRPHAPLRGAGAGCAARRRSGPSTWRCATSPRARSPTRALRPEARRSACAVMTEISSDSRLLRQLPCAGDPPRAAYWQRPARRAERYDLRRALRAVCC